MQPEAMLVLQLITWAEMELRIIASEHEVLDALLPAQNPAPDLGTLSAFDAAAARCPAPLTIFLWWKRSVVPTLFGCHSPPSHTR